MPGSEDFVIVGNHLMQFTAIRKELTKQTHHRDGEDCSARRH